MSADFNIPVVVSSVNDALFIATGKCGTSTLWDLPGNDSDFCDTVNIMSEINRRLAMNPVDKMFITIREPQQRFLSGLFEEVGERMVRPILQSMHLKDHEYESIITQQQFWTDNIQNYFFQFGSCLPNRQATSTYAYHAGNWLHLVGYLLSAYPQLQVVELDQFGALLSSLNLPPLNINQSADKFIWVSNNIKDRELIKLFEKAYLAVEPEFLQQITTYLEHEIQLYAGIQQLNRHWHV